MESQVQNICGASQQDRVEVFVSAARPSHVETIYVFFIAALFQCEAPGMMMPGLTFLGELFL